MKKKGYYGVLGEGRQRKRWRLRGRESGKEERRKEKCGWHGGGGGILHS